MTKGGGKTILMEKWEGGGGEGSVRNSMLSGLGACFPIKFLNL